jgi:hypothetical protein
MPPATRSAEREEERRLNTRTLTIASVASASAAAVTSQLWIAGTWIAAALTPVLVALISEAMHRPTERIARAWTATGEPRGPRAWSPDREQHSSRAQRRSRAISPTRAEPAAVTGSRSTLLTRRRIALGTVVATAAIACVIGLLTLTTVDLVSGGSVGKGSGRFTLAGGSKSKSDQQDQQKDSGSQPSRQQESTSGQNSTQRDTTTTPTETTPTAPPTDTAPVPPPSQTAPGEPVPQTQSP